MRLFLQECKRIFKSLIFFGLFILFIWAITGQLENNDYKFKKPDASQKNYGHYLTNDISYIYSNLITDLKASVDSNYFKTYPYGFFRKRNLKQDELDVIKEIMSDLSGLPYEKIGGKTTMNIPDKEKLEKQLDKIDAIIGGASFYAKDRYWAYFGNKGMNYDEAMADYLLMKDNGYDVAFARYFSDYAGIFILIFSWIIGLYFCNKDRRYGIASTLYVKQISSAKLIFARVLAMSLTLLFIILFIFTYYEVSLIMLHELKLLNPLKAYVLVILWILPIIFFVVSLSTFLTIATNSILIGFLGPIFSMVYLMSSSENIFYNINYGLLLRYNTVGNEAYFLSKLDTFFVGRAIWMAISFLIIIFTIFIYERRRRGYNAFKSSVSIKG